MDIIKLIIKTIINIPKVKFHCSNEPAVGIRTTSTEFFIIGTLFQAKAITKEINITKNNILKLLCILIIMNFGLKRLLENYITKLRRAYLLKNKYSVGKKII